MSTNTQRGRKVQKRKSSLMPFYIGIGVVVTVGAILLGYTLLNRGGDVPEFGSLPKTTINAATGKDAQGYWYKGNPDAPVKVIEYADFQCPGCASFSTGLGEQITKQYIESGQVQLSFREFPLPQHQQAVPAAMAARCAGEQGDFWSMHDTIYRRQNDWSENRNAQNMFVGYAKSLGLDAAAFESCVADNTFKPQIDASVKEGEAAQIPATPSFLIDGKVIPTNGLVPAIEAALTAAK